MPRFRNIRQFTSYGNWTCDVPIRQINTTISEWQEAYYLDLCPDFQRGHVWTDEQQSRYLEYILRGGRSARDIYLNAPFWDSMNVTRNHPMVCVDGLQRLTAAQRFLNNEIPVFGAVYSEYTDKLSWSFCFTFHVNNLKPRVEVLQWYLDMNSSGVIHSEDELKRVQLLLLKEMSDANRTL
ncbi:MAG: DUF262 domain-containing protein [Rhodospirillales bacterium]|nr:DUF262 domain-containing protein [Rhodospirillales bacterium]